MLEKILRMLPIQISAPTTTTSTPNTTATPNPLPTDSNITSASIDSANASIWTQLSKIFLGLLHKIVSLLKYLFPGSSESEATARDALNGIDKKIDKASRVGKSFDIHLDQEHSFRGQYQDGFILILEAKVPQPATFLVIANTERNICFQKLLIELITNEIIKQNEPKLMVYFEPGIDKEVPFSKLFKTHELLSHYSYSNIETFYNRKTYLGLEIFKKGNNNE